MKETHQYLDKRARLLGQMLVEKVAIPKTDGEITMRSQIFMLALLQ